MAKKKVNEDIQEQEPKKAVVQEKTETKKVAAVPKAVTVKAEKSVLKQEVQQPKVESKTTPVKKASSKKVEESPKVETIPDAKPSKEVKKEVSPINEEKPKIEKKSVPVAPAPEPVVEPVKSKKSVKKAAEVSVIENAPEVKVEPIPAEEPIAVEKAKPSKKAEKEIEKPVTEEISVKVEVAEAPKPESKAKSTKNAKKSDEAKTEKVETVIPATKTAEAKTAEEAAPAADTTGKPSVRFSDEDLEMFQNVILESRREALEELRMLKERLEDLTNYDFAEESMIYSMHMAEQGSEAMEKEKTYAQIQRINEYIKKLDDALQRIKDKTYGICRVCACLIAKERLLAVPITTLSASYKIHQRCPEDGVDRIEPVRN